MFTVCYEAWSLSLVECEEHLKLCMYYTLPCVTGTPTQPALAWQLILTMTEEEPLEDSTPRSRRVGARVPCHSIPRELQILVGVAVADARRAGIIQEPAILQPDRHIR